MFSVRQILVFIILCPVLSHSQIYINEFQAANRASVLNSETNDFIDWLELYNAGNDPVNLNGYYLSDDNTNLQKWKIGNVSILSQDYIVFWADNSDHTNHVNFKLDGDGEFIFLVNPDGDILDSLKFGEQYPDISQGRNPNNNTWSLFDRPTPGQINSTVPYSLNTQQPSAVNYSPQPGFYAPGTTVSLLHEHPEARIYYTLDGSEPDSNDHIYLSPIIVSENVVIRSRAYINNQLPGKEVSASYLTDDSVGLPVISLSFNEEYFWDEEIGIYIDGNKSVNYSWERPVNMEIFDSRNPYVTMGAGVHLYGAITRFVDMPSLAVHTRQQYGTKSLKTKLFDDKNIHKFKSFVLRNSGSDWEETMFNDALMQSLVKDRMDIDYQEYQPAIVYFNGTYWGIHNIREKLNEDYLEANHGVNADSVDIVFRDNVVVEGSADDYINLYDYVRFNSLSIPENYAVVDNWMDINEYMNYYIAEIYFFNQDWPMNNAKFWREQKDEAKWRWLLYDLDFGFGATKRTDNMVEWATDPSIYQNYIFIRLLENEGFRNEFLQRFQAHMNTSFHPDRVIALIDSFQNRLRPYMPRHIERWDQPSSLDYWENKVENMRSFASQRLPELKHNLNAKFGIHDENELTVHVAQPEGGTIRICEVEIPDTFAGSFYTNIPIRIEAEPAPGFKFAGWSGCKESTESTTFITLSKDELLIADFIATSPIENLVINEIMAKNTSTTTDENGQYEDWIELHNSGINTVNIAGLLLSDDREKLGKYRISSDDLVSTQILPGNKILLFADNDPDQGMFHLNFKLSAKGESLYLSQLHGNDTIILDSLNFGRQYANLSFGRNPDASHACRYLKPTPNLPNAVCDPVSGIIINEFSASNSTLYEDNGQYYDWIEIQNINTFPVDIGGMFLTDSLPNPYKYRIPDTYPDSTIIAPGEFLIIFASDKAEESIRHANFKLGRNGEQIGLSNKDGSIWSDSLSYSKQYKNSSLSRYPNGTKNWVSLYSTPGAENLYSVPASVRINEFSASNYSLLSDDNGANCDWIEIYNAGQKAINLGGFYFTDSLEHPMKYRIPSTAPDSTILNPGSYLIFFADNFSENGIFHLNFKLSRDGEELGISNHLTEYLDTFTYNKQFKNSSLSRYPENTSNWETIPSTPGMQNVYRAPDDLIINEFSASNKTLCEDSNGNYSDWIEIYNSGSSEINLAGLYLTDSLANPKKTRIPSTALDSTVIEPNSYLVFYADNEPGSGVFHLDFKLSRKQEQIGISSHTGEYLDSVSYFNNYKNASISRFPNASAHWTSIPPSPGSKNTYNSVKGLIINEICSSNDNILANNNGQYSDWIEIYNSNPFPVNMAGLFFTDSLGVWGKHRIPSTAKDSTLLNANDYMVFYADNNPEGGIHHLNFKLSRNGEQIALTGNLGEIIDSVTYQKQYKNASVSRYPNGSENWETIPSTPFSKNLYTAVKGVYINEFSANNTKYQDEHGDYDDWIEVYNANTFDINIGGYFLTDSLGLISKYRIPSTFPDSTTISAKSSILLWADNQEEQGVLHLGFKLSAKGEDIGIAQSSTLLLDSLSFTKQYANCGLSRYPDGNASLLQLPNSPGRANIIPDFSNIYINEVASQNSGNFLDEFNEADDWFEIYNNNPYSVDLGGLYFSDDATDLKKFRICSNQPEKTTLQPYEYHIYWADDSTEQGPDHMNFKLSKNGEWIGLFTEFAPEPYLLDSVSYGDIGEYSSFGRAPELPTSWMKFSEATPGKKNIVLLDIEGVNSFADVFYPNPFKEQLYFQPNQESAQLIRIEVINSQGIKVGIHQFSFGHKSDILLDFSGQPSGIYFIVVYEHESKRSYKVIKD